MYSTEIQQKSPTYQYEKILYKKCSIIEIMFGGLKDWLGVALSRCRSSQMLDSAVCLA